MDGWPFLPSYENQNDLPIRKFCPARIEHEQGGEWEEIELVSPSHSPTTLCLEEEDQIVDSFIDIDNYGKDENQNQSLNQNQPNDDYFQNNTEAFFESEMSCSLEDFDVVMEMVPRTEEAHQMFDNGLQLVHKLLACAEAVGCRDTHLANSLLSQIWDLASPTGDSLQRVSFCFASGLKSRLSLLSNVNLHGGFMKNGVTDDVSMITKEEKIEAFQFLYQTTPYIAFGFLAANETICNAARGKESLHIIDLGMEHSLQWNSLIRTLASRAEGPPKELRITGVGEISPLDLETSMNCLIDEAKKLGINLEFRAINEPLTPTLLTREKLELREGESLYVNSIMHLHEYVKESRGSLKAILQAIKKLCPNLLILMEQDANHNGPFFLGRFLESLHYYSAIFDSLEASLPRTSPQRIKIERFYFAEKIRNIVAYEGSARIERHERADQWRRQLGRAGFQVMGLKCMSQVRMMLSVYGCDGYTLGSEKGCLLLGWKGRPIMLASAWQPQNVGIS